MNYMKNKKNKKDFKVKIKNNLIFLIKNKIFQKNDNNMILS